MADLKKGNYIWYKKNKYYNNEFDFFFLKYLKKITKINNKDLFLKYIKKRSRK